LAAVDEFGTLSSVGPSLTLGKKFEVGTPIRDCIKRDRLIRDWHEAVERFSDSLEQVKKMY
jgi:hypothetical protein